MSRRTLLEVPLAHPLPKGLTALALSLLLLSPPVARAAADVAEPNAPFRFQGRAFYVGGGAGVLPDVREPTQNWSLMLTFPLARWASIEANGFGFHFAFTEPMTADRASTVALGIGTGLRIHAPADWRVRPYAATRLQHLHMLYDPYAMPAHLHHPGMSHGPVDHTSMHRWGLGLGAGFEGRITNRFRAGVEGGYMLFSGQGTNVAIQGIAFVGFGF
jgi:hypothetical protein